MISAQEALERLHEGNRRFVSDIRSHGTLTSQARRPSDLAAGQEPFAIILGCSDSRVPAEIVFDQGLGDLFVIRVAGNIVALLKSAASNLLRNDSAHDSSWCWGTPIVGSYWQRWKNWGVPRKINRETSVRSSIASGRLWKSC
jgi:Carbonic anhydrase